MFSNMRYCPETVLIQSTFFLAEKLTNLDEEKHEDVLPAVKVVVDGVSEVSKGLCIHGEEELMLLPTEKLALHCKLHFWLYRTWCKSYDSIHECDELDGFPTLPKFGTRMFLSVVQELHWEKFLIECLLYSSLKTLPMKVQDIIAVILYQPSSKDLSFFTLLFDNLLDLEFPCISPSGPSFTEMLIAALDTLSESMNSDSIIQVQLLKKMIEHVFKMTFGIELIFKQMNLGQDYSKQPNHKDFSSLTTPQTTSNISISTSNIEKLSILELQKLQDSLESTFCLINPQTRSKACYLDSQQKNKDTPHLREDVPKVCNFLELLMRLFTLQWKSVCHWKESQEAAFGHIDVSEWHPLHCYILGLYSAIGFITINCKHEKFQSFFNELAKYVNCFATKSEKKWVSRLLEGVISNENDWSEQQEESFDDKGSPQTFMFTSDSIEDSLRTAVWRINQNLPGSEDCFNWLLTTEELFDNPMWLQCIKKNAAKFAGKEQLLMMVDILCIQRQMLESQPESSKNVFIAMKEVIIDVFKDLPSLEQEDILDYTFSMSVLYGLDIKQNSVLLNPSTAEDNNRELLEQLQVVFNKLVDSSEDVAFTATLSDVKQIALMSPYLVLSKAIDGAIKFGHSNNIIYKILQEVPVLCTLTASESSPTLLCQIMSSLPASTTTKQEEKNLLKLVKLLLKPYNQAGLPVLSQPLLNITELVQICIIPKIKLSSNKNTASYKLILKILKASLVVLDVNAQTAKVFIFKFLVPITLTLMKQLDVCKVSLEDMSPQLSQSLSLVEAAAVRSQILDVLNVSVNVILSCFQGHVVEVASPIMWLSQKIDELSWTTALYIKPLKDLLPSQQYSSVPTCVMEVCGLSKDKWKSLYISGCDVINSLFECCAVSESVLSEVVDNLKEDALKTTTDNLNDQVIKSLCQIMTYFTTAEMSRVMSLSKELIKLGVLIFQEIAGNPVPIKPATHDVPSFNSACILSSLLLQVFHRVMTNQTSPVRDSQVFPTMVKHYVNTMKDVCQELIIDSDKSLRDDVIAHLFAEICQVISLIPIDVTDPLFILALDVASSINKCHSVVLRDSVSKAPISVYTESLLQKLGT